VQIVFAIYEKIDLWFIFFGGIGSLWCFYLAGINPKRDVQAAPTDDSG
jgi:hypothetical protein